MKYLRRPVEVDAVLWDGSEGAREALESILGGPSKQMEKGLLLVAGMMVAFGTWVVKMPDGVVRGYQPKDFEAKYMLPVEAEANETGG